MKYGKLFITKIKKALKLPYVNDKGYKQHFNPNSPDAKNDGFSPVHRDVARKAIKDDIPVGKCVHHKDGNKLNNSKKNLQVVSNKEHHDIHKAEGKEIWGWKYSKKKK